MVRPGRKLKKIIMILGITGAVYGGFKYLLPLVIPFLLAYLTAQGLRPSVRYLERRLKIRLFKKERHLPAAVIGGIELLLLGAVLTLVLYWGGRLLLAQLSLFSSRFPIWLTEADRALTGILTFLESRLGLEDGSLISITGAAISNILDQARQSTMPLLMNNSVNVMRWGIRALVFLVVFFVAVLLTLEEMDEIREKKSRSFFHREFTLMSRRLVTVGNAWLKTQLTLMAITSVLCIFGLFLIGNPYSILFGIGIGILDALPLFGTGSVLIPWGIILFIKRQWWQGMVLLGLYLVCYLIRQFTEARIMGSRMGLSALETLISMYVGLELFGIAGFILGPMGLLFIEDFLNLYWGED